MKDRTKHLAFIAMAFLAIAACSKQEEEPNQNNPSQPSTPTEDDKPKTFTVSFQQMTYAKEKTKAELGTNLALNWKAGDRIAIFCGRTGGSSYSSYVTSAGDGAFTGSGSKASRYWGAYPTSAVKEFLPATSTTAPDTLLFKFPAQQKGINGSFDPDAFVSVGTTENTTLALQNVGGLLHFVINGADISQVILRSPNGGRFGGSAKITLGSDNNPKIETYVDRQSAFSVWMTPSTGSTFENGGSYFISAPAQDLPDGVKIILRNTEGKEAIWLDPTPRELKRSTVIDLGIIDATSLIWEDVAVVEFLKESGGSLLWPFSAPEKNPFPTGYKDSKQVEFMRTRTAMTLKGVGDFVIYPEYDVKTYSDPTAALGKSYVAPTNHTGFRYGSTAGSYLEVPGVEGKAIYKITLTLGTNGEYKGTGAVTTEFSKPVITDPLGNEVPGGESAVGSFTKGQEYTWKIAGTNGMPYRIVSQTSSEVDLLEVRVFYAPSSGELNYMAQGLVMMPVSISPVNPTDVTFKGKFEALPYLNPSKFACAFEYKLASESSWNQLPIATPAESFSANLTGLEADKEYEGRVSVTVNGTASYSKTVKFTTTSTFIEEKEDSEADIIGSYDYSKIRELGHPRILMTGNDFETLAERVRNKSEWPMLAKFNDQIISRANVEVNSSQLPEYKLDASNKRLLSVSRNVLGRLSYCSYAYRMTGDKKYLDKAVQTLDIVCGEFSDWHPSHYLDVGEMALGVAVAYDWLYYDLDYATRLKTRKALSNYAINTALNNSSGKSATQTTTNNWNSVCNGGIVAAALAAYPQDKKNSAKVIENALTSNAKAVASMYSPDGNYGEGYGYWEYGTSFQVCLVHMLKKAFGDDHGLSAVPGFMKTGEFMLFMATAAGGNFSFADGGSSSESLMSPMWWFAAQSGNSALLANEIRLMNAGKTSSDRMVPFVPSYILDFSFDASNLGYPSSNMWTGNGLVPIAMIHTGWNFDANDKYVGIKGGAPNGPHGHMDVGSFVYESQGVRWSDDLTRPDYARMENLTAAAGGSFWNTGQKSLRWDIFRMNNLCHSTLAFSNSDNPVAKNYYTDQIVSGKAEIIEKFTEEGSQGVTLNLTKTYSDQVASAKRTIRLIGDDLVITDEITAKPAMNAEMMWRMLTKSQVSPGTDVETLSRDGKTLKIRVQTSEPTVNPTFTSWPAERPSNWAERPAEWDDANTGYSIAGYTATIPAGTTVTFVTTLSAN